MTYKINKTTKKKLPKSKKPNCHVEEGDRVYYQGKQFVSGKPFNIIGSTMIPLHDNQGKFIQNVNSKQVKGYWQ